MKHKNIVAALFALLALQSPVALAATGGVEFEPISFGQVVIIDPTASHTCTIPAGGTMTCDSTTALTILNQGQYGVFRLQGFSTSPPASICALVTSPATLAGGKSGYTLQVSNFTFAPNIDCNTGTAMAPGTDGMLTIKIGATITTTAGVTYDIAPYRGTYDLQINY